MVGFATILKILGVIATVILLPMMLAFKGQPTLWDNTLGGLDEIRAGNQSFKIPKNESNFNFNEWVKEIPVKNILDMIFAGTGGVVSWVSRGIAGGATAIIKLVAPSVVVPPFMGLIIFLFVAGMLFAKSLEQFSHLGYTVWQYAIVILFVALIISIAFLLLGII